jgi:hypothetical protein
MIEEYHRFYNHGEGIHVLHTMIYTKASVLNKKPRHAMTAPLGHKNQIFVKRRQACGLVFLIYIAKNKKHFP